MNTTATTHQGFERPTPWEFTQLTCAECGETFVQTIELLNHQDRSCPAMRQARTEHRRLRRRGRRR